MSYEKVKSYFTNLGLGNRVKELDQSSATVEMAANALNCMPQQIAKTISFLVNEKPVLIVMAGNKKSDNQKFKSFFGQRPEMIPMNMVEEFTGHFPGGVCPFAIKNTADVYLDDSLKQNEIVYLAAGSSNGIVELNIKELEQYSNYKSWIDISK